jgi:O-antigen ligase
MLAAGRRANFQRLTALIALVAGSGVVIIVGIHINRSLAAYGLGAPVLLASALILLPPRSRLRPWLVGLAGLLLAATVLVIARSAVGSVNLGQDASSSVVSREAILDTTSHAIKDYMPLGSGLGSFRQLYDQYEDLGQVTTTFVVHAHNDYAEIALETGVPGLIVLLLFLGWWVAAVWRVWRSPEAGPFARAASIASAAILAHSLVDFPLRTAAISTCFAMFVALIADRRAPPPADASDLRPTRHFVLR